MALPKKILVPVDFSENSKVGMGMAVELAQRLDAEVELFHAILIPAFPLEGGAVVGEAFAKQLENEAQKNLDQWMALPKPSGIRVTGLWKTGDPRDLILERIKEKKVDLVVMSSHGRKGLSRLLLGSVAEDVLRRASCPVLIVR